MLLDIYKKKSKFFIYVFLFFAGFYFVFLTNCAYCQKGLNASYENDLAYIQVVKESVDSLQNFLILLDKNIVKENEQINNFSLDIALQQLEIINKELLAIKKEDFYCQNLIKSFFSLCNLVKSIKILKFSDKQKILKAINIIKKDYICSDNLQSNYIKQKTDFLIENIVSLSDLIRSVFLTQKIELIGLGSKIFDKFIYKPCRFIVDNKKNV
ncbi:hypothetical protein K9M16_03220, partial [Candidatus Babeliales bacterium]|nr:hypothetical protein [Candidatus Babeliales bacterium]